MNIRDFIEGDTFYRRRDYKGKYKLPVPYRALSEYELSQADYKSEFMLSDEDKKIIESIEYNEEKPEDTELTHIQGLCFKRKVILEDMWIVFLAIKPFVEGVTFDHMKIFKGLSVFAKRIREDSGANLEEKVKDF